MRPIYLATMTLLMMVSLFSAALADGDKGTPIHSEMAQFYMKKCMEQKDDRLQPATQRFFCQCTTTFMERNMYLEDMRNMQGNDQKARDALNKMILRVYAPCMEFPVHDLIYKNCRAQKVKLTAPMCECLASKMSDYTAREARRLLEGILTENPNVTDPMAAIVNSPAYAEAERQIVSECVMQ